MRPRFVRPPEHAPFPVYLPCYSLQSTLLILVSVFNTEFSDVAIITIIILLFAVLLLRVILFLLGLDSFYDAVSFGLVVF